MDGTTWYSCSSVGVITPVRRGINYELIDIVRELEPRLLQTLSTIIVDSD